MSTERIKDFIDKQLENLDDFSYKIEIDENHIVAFQGFSPSQIQAGWSVGNVLRGEGLSLMKVTGPGKVYLSPLPILIHSTK